MRKELVALKENDAISGRQIVKMIYEWFETDAHMATVYGYGDLTDIVWMGDNNIGEFLHFWDHVVDNLEDRRTASNCTTPGEPIAWSSKTRRRGISR